MKLVKGLFYIALLVTIILNASGTTAYAYRAQSVSPESFLSSSLNNPNLKQAPGESWAWNAAYNIEHFMYAYRAWGDTGWLDAAVKYYDYLVSQLQKGPDGYLGWIGPYIYDTTQWCDAHVSDALLFNGMLHFAEIVLQNPELEKVYGEKARHYVQLAEVHLIEKWDARGTWYEYSPFHRPRSLPMNAVSPCKHSAYTSFPYCHAALSLIKSFHTERSQWNEVRHELQ